MKELYQPIWKRSPHGPSYIPTQVFGAALVDLLVGRGPSDAVCGIRAALEGAAVDPVCAGLATALRDALKTLDDGTAEALASAACSDERDDPKARGRRRDMLAKHMERVAASTQRALFLSLVEAADGPQRQDISGRFVALARVGASSNRVWRAVAGMPPSAARTALLAWFEATGPESRARAAEGMETIVRGGADGCTQLQELVRTLPAGHLRDVINRCVSEAEEAARATAMLDLLRLADRPAEELRRAVELVVGDGETGRLLTSLLDRSTRSVADARHRLEGWFDHAMEHCSATYKRKSQLWLLGIAAVVVAVFNVDAVRVTKELVENVSAREAIVRVARQRASEAPPAGGGAVRGGDDAAVSRLQTNVDRALAMPPGLGWKDDPVWTQPPAQQAWVLWLSKIAGLLVSVAALSLGAPFWFSVVNIATNLRVVGEPPRPKQQQGNEGTARSREDDA